MSPSPLEGPALALALAAVVGAVMMLTAAVWRVGVAPSAMVALLFAAPLVAHETAALYSPRPNVIVAMNYAGFALPVILSAWFVISGRAPLWAVLVASAITTVVCYYSSVAVPHEGVLLHYRLPALVAGACGALFAWGAWEKAGPIAFSAGAWGVIVGADFLRIHELMTPSGNHRIILGGAGVADGIFIVAILAVLVVAFARSMVLNVERLRGEGVRQEPGDLPSAAPGPERDGAPAAGAGARARDADGARS